MMRLPTAVGMWRRLGTRSGTWVSGRRCGLDRRVCAGGRGGAARERSRRGVSNRAASSRSRRRTLPSQHDPPQVGGGPSDAPPSSSTLDDDPTTPVAGGFVPNRHPRQRPFRPPPHLAQQQQPSSVTTSGHLTSEQPSRPYPSSSSSAFDVIRPPLGETSAMSSASASRTPVAGGYKDHRMNLTPEQKQANYDRYR